MLFDEQVALKCGVERETLKRWLTLGVLPDAKEPYASFAKDYVDARLQVEENALEDIRQGENGKNGADWKARAWFLERFEPGRWGKNVPVSGPRESVNIQTLLEQTEERRATLGELFDEPPPELVAAIKEKRQAILALLSEPEDPPELPEG